MDEAAYNAFLAQRGVTRADFEHVLGQLIVSEKLRAVIVASVSLPEEEAWRWYGRQGEKVKARFIQIPAKDLVPLTSADDDTVSAFYEANANTPQGKGPFGAGYLQPEKVKIETVMALSSTFGERADLSEDQIAAYYEEHKEDYRKPDPDKASQEDSESEGTTSDEEKSPEYTPLAEVKEQIEKTLRREAGDREVERVMKEVNEVVWKALEVPFGSDEVRTVDLAAIAEQFGLEHRVTDYFSAEEASKIMPGATALTKRAFGQGMDSIGYISTVLDARDGKFVFKTLGIKPAAPAPLDEVRSKVLEHARLKAASEMTLDIATTAVTASDIDDAASRVEAAIADLLNNAGEAVKEKAATAYYQRGETPFFGRVLEYSGRRFHFGAGLPGNFDSVNFAEAAFNLKDGEVGMASDADDEPRAVCLLQRTEAQSPERADFDAQKERIVPQLLQAKRAETLRSWKADLRRRAHPSEEVLKFLVLIPDWSS